MIGSSGSVLTTFRAQARVGGPITVTDPAVTRYFMTVGEAVQLVIQAGVVGRSGEVLVLDMGAPVRIDDIAQRFAARSSVPIPIVYTGLRPGEKLHETMLSQSEIDTRPFHSLIAHVAAPPLLPSEVAEISLDGSDDDVIGIMKYLSVSVRPELKATATEPIVNYDKFYGSRDFQHDPTRSRSFLRTLLDKHPPASDGCVLDLGCGTGFHSRMLAGLGRRVVGVDLSKVAVAKAMHEDRTRRGGYAVADCSHLPFQEGSLGAVLCLALTPFSNADSLEETRGAVADVLRSLDDGGVLYFLWPSDLSGRRHYWDGGGSWMHYTRSQWDAFFASQERAERVASYVVYNRAFPLLGPWALSSPVSRLTTLITKATRHRALIVCVVRKAMV